MEMLQKSFKNTDGFCMLNEILFEKCLECFVDLWYTIL